jgi:hypothetical protein
MMRAVRGQSWSYAIAAVVEEPHRKEQRGRFAGLVLGVNPSENRHNARSCSATIEA